MQDWVLNPAMYMQLQEGSRFCGPGCRCRGCSNVPSNSDEDDLHDLDMRRAEMEEIQNQNVMESDDDSEVELSDGNDDSETEEIMARVFGDESDRANQIKIYFFEIPF